MSVGPFEAALRARRDAGGKCLVVYVTGGLGDDWLETARAVAAAGADAIEVGVPFSDPVMDGPTIQAANDLALAAGATPGGILGDLRSADIGVPLAVMTYYNIAFRMGLERFAESLVEADVAGCILPDLPLEEAGTWLEVAGTSGVEPILLAAPTASDERLTEICAVSKGFVYGVGLLGVTGVRSELAASAVEIASRLKPVTDLPVLVGVGIGTPDQAVAASGHGDGVVVGSAVVQLMVDGAGPEGVGELVASFRAALDAS
ncbi:MAG: tryptophan synthase subunit alpha [Actinomycetota bacterium]|nr:tryptophan synthase subunit alpha [Actinomycetota bacterium]MED6328476.1 tryptophan synthase subunit alpha [Actinomycetota bacterium]MEE2958601.1 tryptophan synthase subunit alpha [Actinomycetota bacterium]